MHRITDEVILKAADGDIRSFQAIYKAYSGFVFNIALRTSRSREDAKEITQEVFIKVYHKLHSYRYRSSLKTWIYRITVNMTINYLTKQARFRKKIVEYDDAIISSYSRDEASENAEKEHKDSLVNKLLGLLTPDQRICVVLRNIDGLSYEQIAQTLKIDINAVRSRLKRAREKLMELKKEVMANEM